MENSRKPQHDKDYEEQAENPAEPRPSISIIAVVTTAAAQQYDEKNDQ